MTKAATLDDRRRARLAAIAAERMEDAKLDHPILQELKADAAALTAMADKAGLLISKATQSGVNIQPQIGNLRLVETQMQAVLDALIAEAESVISAADKKEG